MKKSSIFRPKHEKLTIDTSSLAADMSYIFVYPICIQDRLQAGLRNIAPCMLTFRSEDITVKELIQRVKDKCKAFKLEGHLNFSDPDGTIIRDSYNMRQAKNMIKVDNINGLAFYLTPEQPQSSQAGSYYQDQASISQYITNYQLQPRPSFFQLHFQLPNTSIILSTSFSFENRTNLHRDLIIKQLLSQISTTFGISLDPSDIKTLTLKECKREITEQIDILTMPEIANRSYVVVEFTKAEFQLPEIKVMGHSTVVIYDEEDGTLPVTQSKDKGNYVKVDYETIRTMTFETFYHQFFRKQAISKSNIKSLKIDDVILTPADRFSLLEPIFAQKGKKQFPGVISLVGHVIGEKMMFYQQLSTALQNKKPFSMKESDLIFDNEEHRLSTHNKIADSIRTTHSASSEKAISAISSPQLSFIELIYYYTSNLRVRLLSQTSKGEQKIYLQLNQHLQEQTILYKTVEDINQSWIYQYTYSMHSFMQTMDNSRMIVYRGINYDLDRKIGEIVPFKSWLSTSRSKCQAVTFAMQNYDNPATEYQDVTKQLVLLMIHSLTGKNIEKFSHHPEEEEVLFEPYSSFRVVDRFLDDYNYIRPFIVYVLEEVTMPKELPGKKTNFIIWVDPDPREGTIFQQEVVKVFPESTVFMQLESNKELEQWMSPNIPILEDPQSQVVFISNMTRKESEVAGTETVELIRNTLNRVVPIAIYVGNRALALQKLDTKHLKVIPDVLQVHNDQAGLVRFLERQINVQYFTPTNEPPDIDLPFDPKPPLCSGCFKTTWKT